MIDDLVAAVDDRSARGIAAAVNRLIGSGRLSPGDRLPTVRALARALGTSPTTVSEAWQSLARVGAIESRGRNGTVVLGPAPAPGTTRRYRRVTQGPGRAPLDLSTGTPDPGLLPDLRPALGRVSRDRFTTGYTDDPVLPALGELLRDRWPFEPEALTVVDGALDALDRVAGAIVRLGDRVLVENPTFPPLLDLLDLLGAEVVPLELDEHGIVPASLRRGLALEPAALFLQPRAQNPTGVSMTAARAATLARMLRDTDLWVIEDDHSGAVAEAPVVSLGSHRPGHTVHILGFAKSHGPDLRLAAIGGAAGPVGAVVERRLIGPGWSSRLLQGVLADLLTDPASVAAVDRARAAYADRRRRLADGLTERAVATTGSDGLNLWIEVERERDALVALAAQGIAVAPGSPFLAGPLPADHVRLTSGLVRDGFDDLADHLADAAAPTPTRWGRTL